WSCWFLLPPAEIQKLLGDRKDFGQCGTTICGTKCRMLRDNLDTDGMNSLDLKTAPDTEGNTYNICIGKTGKTLVIAKGKKDANGGQVATKVFETVSHLKKAQF
uniref:Profilin n=1 Tax=Echeneis naucrates TaxID=173247 RepID=A0A665TQ62_ECHNA